MGNVSSSWRICVKFWMPMNVISLPAGVIRTLLRAKLKDCASGRRTKISTPMIQGSTNR